VLILLIYEHYYTFIPVIHMYNILYTYVNSGGLTLFSPSPWTSYLTTTGYVPLPLYITTKHVNSNITNC
jgi:hypothetical protein